MKCNQQTFRCFTAQPHSLQAARGQRTRRSFTLRGPSTLHYFVILRGFSAIICLIPRRHDERPPEKVNQCCPFRSRSICLVLYLAKAYTRVCPVCLAWHCPLPRV